MVQRRSLQSVSQRALHTGAVPMIAPSPAPADRQYSEHVLASTAGSMQAMKTTSGVRAHGGNGIFTMGSREGWWNAAGSSWFRCQRLRVSYAQLDAIVQSQATHRQLQTRQKYNKGQGSAKPTQGQHDTACSERTAAAACCCCLLLLLLMSVQPNKHGPLHLLVFVFPG